ncbi:hypothetical protein TSO5_15180 [Azospirillum sp. TSO5]|nr:hypothetical protein TSO5_15180 [Azospirillum sp. TSO5]
MRVLVEILDRPVAAGHDHRVIGVHVDFRQDLRLLQPRRAAGEIAAVMIGRFAPGVAMST